MSASTSAGTTGAGVASTSAQWQTGAQPAAAQAGPLPRCSASVRDRCVQDERFASDVDRPGSRDNNARHYRN
jgi:hypothetical protein